jgi:hypothetical protein
MPGDNLDDGDNLDIVRRRINHASVDLVYGPRLAFRGRARQANAKRKPAVFVTSTALG